MPVNSERTGRISAVGFFETQKMQQDIQVRDARFFLDVVAGDSEQFEKLFRDGF